jgi:hypothetical protein
MPLVCCIDLQLIMKIKCGKELLKPGKNTVNPDDFGTSCDNGIFC